ncbi:hypothetical protein MBOU_00850 [Mycobacterium bourgelatii]|uniref:Uncharacterized protein n=1 Tax=Mycobacterium bourgelatii TaxID=1273442 RepID=A0A7I9YHR8_MYCBU|nr:hypothetical protein MBOU_00850 [Mycobacterium bourgelatii]
MRDARQRGESRSRGGQVGGSLTLVNRQAEGPAARGETADYVSIYLAVHPCRYRLTRKHADITKFHAPDVS